MVNYIRRNGTAALFLALLIAVSSNSAFAESTTVSSKATGGFVALQAGNDKYGNFLWVLDTVTGKVVAYRIASFQDAQGKHDAWVTERLLTEEEYAQFLRSQKK